MSQTIRQMSGRVSELLADRLALHGSLTEQMRAGRRVLPRRVTRALLVLQRMEELSSHPRTASRASLPAAQKAYQTAVKYLAPLGEFERVKNRALDLGAVIALALLLLGIAAVVIWLRR